MGMFDWYKPKERTCCPVCKEVLEEWQGKDGDNALFVCFPDITVLMLIKLSKISE